MHLVASACLSVCSGSWDAKCNKRQLPSTFEQGICLCVCCQGAIMDYYNVDNTMDTVDQLLILDEISYPESDVIPLLMNQFKNSCDFLS